MQADFIPQYEPTLSYFESADMAEYMKNPGFMTEYKKTEEFEKEISKFLHVPYCSVVNNGTISLSLALIALGIKAGDKVLVPDFTMIATFNAVKLIGAIPVLCDITSNLTLNFELADEIVNSQEIKAIIFVSINGRSFNNTAWEYLWKWKAQGIKLIEDAAQSFGSKNYEGEYLACRGFDISSYSFSPPKLITTGQGGALLTKSQKLYNKIKQLKDFGRISSGKDIHTEFGINCKFTEMQAVIGLAQMKNLTYKLYAKKGIYKQYREQLESVPQITFITTDLNNTVPWFIDIIVPDAAALCNHLYANNIGVRRFYPAIHTQPINKEYNDLVFPTATEMGEKGVWLPSFAHISNEQITRVCNTIKEFYGN